MDDLYSDLPEDASTNHHITAKLENEVQNLQSRIRELEGTIRSHEDDNELIRKQLESVQQENIILRSNFSSLYRTAKTEIDRKTQQLQESRKSTSQRSEVKEHRVVDDSANSKKGAQNLDELSNDRTNSPSAPKIGEAVREDDKEEATAKLLNRLVDNYIQSRMDPTKNVVVPHTTVTPCYSYERNSFGGGAYQDQRSEVNEYRVDDSANSKKGAHQNLDELSNRTNSPSAPKIGEAVRKDDEEEATAKLLKRLVDNYIQSRMDPTKNVVPHTTMVTPCYSYERNSFGGGAGSSKLSPNPFSNDKFEIRFQSLEQTNKKRRRSSSRQLTNYKKLCNEKET